MIVIHTDASTKNGYSCWVYKSSYEPKYRAGLVQSSNTAAIETLAVIKALQATPIDKKILIVSDSLVTVRVIQQYGTNWVYTTNAQKYYRKTRQQLIDLLHNRHVDAIWVPSNSTNKIHIEVDNLTKTILQQFLGGGRL